MLLAVAIARILHIIAGIIWAGGAIIMNLVVGPTIGATGDAGKQFAGHLMGKTMFSKLMAASAGTTVLAGTFLYGVNSNWFSSAWMMSGAGIGFGIGALAGIAAFVMGMMTGSTNRALAELGAQIQGKPTAEQASILQALQKKAAFLSPANTICIFVSIIFMASARFFG
jgi:uncharacterized membrane protein